MRLLLCCLLLAGCASTTRTTLVNAEGDTVFCERRNTTGLSGTLSHNRYSECLQAFQMKGYKVQPDPRP